MTMPFRDVRSADWFHDSVQTVWEHGLVKSTSRFHPARHATRAEAVTILYRLAGAPHAEGSSFPDVKSRAWYDASVAWAQSQGIVKGYTNGRFGPKDHITREQFAELLFRYAGHRIQGEADLTRFVDWEDIYPKAREAMEWAVGVGLLIGEKNDVLNPGGELPRAEMAVIICRLLEKGV